MTSVGSVTVELVEVDLTCDEEERLGKLVAVGSAGAGFPEVMAT